MKSKAPLALMEQLVMLLVFALAAAVCVWIFVASDQLSRNNEAVSRAAMAAQTAAEEMKNRGESFEWLYSGYEDFWTQTEEAWVLVLDHDWNPVNKKDAENGVSEKYRLEVREDMGERVSGLIQVRIEVTEGNETLFSIPAAWQEVGGHE